MGNKVSLVLSCILFIQSMLFCGDLIGYQITFTKLSAQSVYIVRQIEKDKMVTEELILMVEDDMNAKLTCLNKDCLIDEDNLLEIKITATYTPLLGAIWEIGVPNITLYKKILIL